MLDFKADVAILGSGFGGSLTALLLDRVGLHPVLFDRGSHPRFAIGESSTPIANLVLRDLTRAYGLPRLEPLAKYGTWQAAYPEVVCGLKRGFSYFHHRPSGAFPPSPRHTNELLVAASSDDEHSDTHWLRSDVDAFLVGEAAAAGIPYFDQTHVAVEARASAWRLEGERDGRPIRGTARFLVDATGEAGFLARTLGIASAPAGLATNSRSIFGHFVGLRPWHDVLAERGARVDDHPFYCDHAALHHVLEEGWMWQLGFNNGVTSVGFVLDAERFPLRSHLSPQEEWDRLLARYPSIAAQFAHARRVQPLDGLRRTGRLQRRAARLVGANWALLPHTAGFIDPLHSTGIAQTLCGIERLVAALEGHWGRASLGDALGRYEQAVHDEIALVDKLVSGGYAARREFRLFAAFALVYFAAATTYERRRAANPKRRQERAGPACASGQLSGSPAGPFTGAFLLADDAELRQIVEFLWDDLERTVSREAIAESEMERFERVVAATIRPYNQVGLGDPAAHNMYRHTAAPPL